MSNQPGQPYAAPAVIVAHFEAGLVTDWRASDNPQGDGAVTTRDTVFRIASMSKSFLAAAALALRDEGILDFTVPITTYVPGMRFVLGGREYSVTIEDLLTNRSGMPEDNAWGDRQLGASREWINELGRAGFRLTSRPGDRYQYSNLGMSLVGRAIEHVTGSPVEEEVRRRLVDPLGLNHTRYRAEEYPAGTPIARGYRSFDEGETFIDEPYVGAGALACIGGLFSTVEDIARWAGFLASAFDGDADDNVNRATHPLPLSARSRREMQRIHTPIAVGAEAQPSELDALGYGLGMFSENDRNLGAIASHAGGLPGFSSHMRWHLASGKGVVAFGNSDAFSASRLAIAEHADRLRRAPIVAQWAGPWPETNAAAERIDDVLHRGSSLAAAADVVAPNFFMDVPAAVRDLQLLKLLGKYGKIHRKTPFRERIVASVDASHIRWRIECELGNLECEIRLIGLKAPSVQSLKITEAATGAR